MSWPRPFCVTQIESSVSVPAQSVTDEGLFMMILTNWLTLSCVLQKKKKALESIQIAIQQSLPLIGIPRLWHCQGTLATSSHAA